MSSKDVIYTSYKVDINDAYYEIHVILVYGELTYMYEILKRNCNHFFSSTY